MVRSHMNTNESPTPERPWLRRPWVSQTAARLALGYALVSILWILLSSAVVKVVSPNQEIQALLEEVKGWFFVVITALGLYYFSRRTFHNIQQLDGAMLQRVVEYQAEIDRYHMLLDASS